MSKFNIGDKVITDDGREGVVLSYYRPLNSIRIGNKEEVWFDDGLKKIEESEEPKFKVGDEVLIRCTVTSIDHGSQDYPIEIEMSGYKFWPEKEGIINGKD